jgi:hypothetical protein
MNADDDDHATHEEFHSFIHFGVTQSLALILSLEEVDASLGRNLNELILSFAQRKWKTCDVQNKIGENR